MGIILVLELVYAVPSVLTCEGVSPIGRRGNPEPSAVWDILKISPWVRSGYAGDLV